MAISKGVGRMACDAFHRLCRIVMRDSESARCALAAFCSVLGRRRLGHIRHSVPMSRQARGPRGANGGPAVESITQFFSDRGPKRKLETAGTFM